MAKNLNAASLANVSLAEWVCDEMFYRSQISFYYKSCFAQLKIWKIYGAGIFIRFLRQRGQQVAIKIASLV